MAGVLPGIEDLPAGGVQARSAGGRLSLRRGTASGRMYDSRSRRVVSGGAGLRHRDTDAESIATGIRYTGGSRGRRNNPCPPAGAGAPSAASECGRACRVIFATRAVLRTPPPPSRPNATSLDHRLYAPIASRAPIHRPGAGEGFPSPSSAVRRHAEGAQVRIASGIERACDRRGRVSTPRLGVSSRLRWDRGR